MENHNYKKTIRLGIIAIMLFIVTLILWNTYSFFKQFKEDERSKMDIISVAYKRLNNPDLNADVYLESQILSGRMIAGIPMVIITESINGKIDTISQNIDYPNKNRKAFLDKQLAIMKSQNEPIVIQPSKKSTKQTIYYKDSKLLTNLKYFPFALILVLILFFTVIYFFLKSSRIASENYLWTGMAKETAHQIGTPLTSLLGWIEILRDEHEDIAIEIEKDVQRLEIIADRFSKIGSENPLKKQDVVSLTRRAYSYLESRSSKKVNFIFESDSPEIIIPLNKELYGWVIENLVKNAIDSMRGEGKLSLRIIEENNSIKIQFSDTGKGIPKKLRKDIFEAGFTTKKRGWGIGLTLSKRIIEDFHNGKIYVKESSSNKGTVFCIELNKN